MMCDPLFYPLFREEIDRLACKPGGKAAPYLVRLEKSRDFARPLLELITTCRVPERFYYSAKDDPFIMGGLGSTLVIEAEDAHDLLNGFSDLWAADETIPVFGGFSFYADEAPSPEWEPFSRCRFTLPFVELRQFPDGIHMAVNYINKRGLPMASVLKEITETLQSLDDRTHQLQASPIPSGLRTQLIPEKPQWNHMIKKALQTIKEGDLGKVVLARKKVVTHRDLWDPAQIITAMAKIEENSFTFFYQIEEGTAFLGRSPERLFRMQDGDVLAEAIAGTRPRGKTALDDERLEAELLNSPKELEEHRFVAGFIEAGMGRLCSDVRIESSEEILKLKNVQHIMTRFTGRSCRNQIPLSIARVFHPTPAVGGYPQEKISSYLKTNEPFRRGWYAAPIGWMNKANADFAVGIRSALVNRNELHIFAGAGIVRQSNAHAEWDETEKKMDNFTAILGEC